MLNHHVVTVKAPAPEVYRQIVLWGESDWWPVESPMRYTRISGEPGVPGSRWHQKVHVPFGPEWDAEIISAIPGVDVSWKFLDGPFRGVYRVYLIPVAGGCEVHFMMDYDVVGAVNKMVWNAFSGRRHDENIKLILSSLKRHLEGRGSVTGEEQELDAQGMERREFFKKIVRR